jgi:hypothetical protein
VKGRTQQLSVTGDRALIILKTVPLDAVLPLLIVVTAVLL